MRRIEAVIPGAIVLLVALLTADPALAQFAMDDFFSTPQGTTLFGNVLDNDSGDPIAVISDGEFTTTQGFTVVLGREGDFTYSPAPSFTGVDNFAYTVEVGTDQSTFDSATVTITVGGENQPPVARDDEFTLLEDTSVTGNVFDDNGNGGDSDLDGDLLRIIEPGTILSFAGGTVVLASDGSFTYTPPADFFGEDGFVYSVGDGNGGLSGGNVVLTVVGQPDPPLVADDRFTVAEDQTLVGNVFDDNGAGHDSDRDGDPISVVAGAVSTSAGGVAVLASDGGLTYTPAADFNGQDSFTYTVEDGTGLSALGNVLVDVTPVNDPPMAREDVFSTPFGQALSGNVLADNGNGADVDVDGDGLLVASPGTVSTLAGGTVVLAADGSFTYTPAPEFSGSDGFDYVIEDGNGGSDGTSVTIFVGGVENAPPQARDDAFSVATGQTLTGNLLADNGAGSDVDPDGDPLTVVAATLVTDAGGTASLQSNGDFSYTPAAGFSGSDGFDYTVSDGQGGSDDGRVTITVTGIDGDVLLTAAVLPNSRSAVVDGTVSAFAVIINAGQSDASGCGIAPLADLPLEFGFQGSDPATNLPNAPQNQLVDIAAGGMATFVMTFTPRAPFPPSEIAFSFDCLDGEPAEVLPGINTLTLSASLTPVIDILALARTIDGNGILDVPDNGGSSAFAVATINLGAGGAVTVTADSGAAALPLDLVICQTDPQTAACLAPPNPTLPAVIAAGDTPTFSIFATARDEIPLAPRDHRVFVRFIDNSGVERGSTSVAVETHPGPPPPDDSPVASGVYFGSGPGAVTKCGNASANRLGSFLTTVVLEDQDGARFSGTIDLGGNDFSRGGSISGTIGPQGRLTGEGTYVDDDGTGGPLRFAGQLLGDEVVLQMTFSDREDSCVGFFTLRAER